MSQFKNITELREAIGVIPTPFASAPFSTVDIPDEDSDSSDSDVDVNFKDGFPEPYTRPIIKADGTVDPTAKVITRRQVNTLGNIGSQTQFFEQCGGYYTFDPKICAKIKGYPKGAVLRFYDENTNTLRTVKSVKENNEDNFIEDRTFIKSLDYSDWQQGDHASWVYMDDNPEVSVVVDYSSFEDISDSIFVDIGVPDYYEVPYDGYLQLWGLAWLSCSDLRRDEVENITLPSKYKDAETYNGMYFTYATGTTYLDILDVKTSSILSSIISGFYPYEWLHWNSFPNKESQVSKICPVSPISFGSFLQKGTKIKIRNELVDKAIPESRFGIQKISDKLFTDKNLRKNYLVKYAKLFKVKFS